MGRFAALPYYLLDCPTWKALSFPAKAAFIQLLRLYNGRNNGQLGMAASKLAERLDCSKATAARALTELEEKGFIGVEKIGTFRRKDRFASEYFLTMHRNDVSGELPTKKFMRWPPHRSGLS